MMIKSLSFRIFILNFVIDTNYMSFTLWQILALKRYSAEGEAFCWVALFFKQTYFVPELFEKSRKKNTKYEIN